MSAAEIWKAKRWAALRRDWWIWSISALLLIGLTVAIPFAHQEVARLLMAAAAGSLATVLYVGWEIGGDIHSLSWRWGQWGERDTEDALRPLEQNGWQVIHDIPRRYGNIDHVLIGPPGVFLLETKRTSGKAAVSGDRLNVGRLSYGGSGFRKSAAALNRALAALRPSWVQAVVVIWGDFDQRVVECDRLVYCSGHVLRDWLEALPPRLAEDQVAALANAVENLEVRAE